MESLNILDICILTVLIISAALAYMRGFIHEVLSIAGWIGAALSVLYSLPVVRPFVQEHIESKMVADGVTCVLIFVIVLISLTFLTHYISGKIRESQLNILDRTAGFVFGLGRGVLILSLGYVFASMFINEKNKPEVIETSKSIFVVEYAVDKMKELVPDDFMPAEMYNISALKGENGDGDENKNDTNPSKEEDNKNDSKDVNDSDIKSDNYNKEDTTTNETNSEDNNEVDASKLQTIIDELKTQIKFLEENGSIADLEKLINLKQKYNDAMIAKENAQKSINEKGELDNRIDEIYNLLTQPKVDGKEILEKNDATQTDSKNDQNKKGYSKKDRSELNRLIDNNQ
ncbi:MAG: hypothetical protein GY804_05020 [Alphaproteobacteria bacterium]|nr:hypothetical protein [Alphaproteobacteria bacterium]